MDAEDFTDLLAANRRYSISAPPNFDGIAHAGVGIVTCMDSRLQPLEMIGLVLGEAKILRTPGGHVTEDALRGLVLGVHLLRVTRILIVQHTRCAMAGGDDAWMRQRVTKATGADLTGFHIGACRRRLKTRPLRRSKTRPPDHDWVGDLGGGLGVDQAAGRGGSASASGREGLGDRPVDGRKGAGC